LVKISEQVFTRKVFLNDLRVKLPMTEEHHNGSYWGRLKRLQTAAAFYAAFRPLFRRDAR
jgi:hypothetical protein